jgi:mono/diheme cytochrome c family protein
VSRGVALISLGLLLAGCGPHMARQYELRPYKQELPPMPAGTVPESGYAPVPTAQEAQAQRNPLPATAETLELGRRYYGYYCQHCHGEDGRGQTPVGESYNPRPTDLTTPAVQGLSDGEMYRDMLTGIGHAPVMAATVAAERRWYVISFLRSLSPTAPDAPDAPTTP